MISEAFKLIGMAVVAGALLIGCSSKAPDTREASVRMPEELRSGFLQDYSRIERVRGEKAVMRWINPEIDWGKYKGFMVEPVDSMVPRAYRDELQPDPKVVAAVTSYFREALIREFKTQFEVVTVPGHGVARVSIAITSFIPSPKQLSAWQYLPIGLVAAGVGEVTGKRDREIVLFMEGEITDSINGELMLEVMQGRTSNEGGVRRIDDITPETVKPVLDFWAKDHVELISKLRAGKL